MVKKPGQICKPNFSPAYKGFQVQNVHDIKMITKKNAPGF